MKVLGLANVPKTGSVIIAANHRSFADPPVVGSAIVRAVHFMAKEELFEFGPFGWLISGLNAHPLKRTGDVGAFKLALNLLHSGCALILFPEGRRSPTTELLKPKAGVGFLSMTADCPVVPTYVHNTAYFRQFKKVVVQFGTPILPQGFESHQALADEVMKQIQKMKDAM